MINIINKYKNMSKPLKASMWFVFCNVVQKGISMITTPIFTRMLSTEEYGTVSIYNSWLSILTIFATYELATGVFNKAMIKYENDRDGYTSATLFLSTLITTVFFLTYLIGADFWNPVFDLNKAIMIMMFVEIYFTTSMSFWSIRQRFDFNYVSVVVITLLANLAGSILSVVLVLSNADNKAEYRILGTVLVHVVIYFFVYFAILKRGKKIYSKEYWKYAIWYNTPLIPHYLSQQILNQSDRIMIGRINGNTYSAIYSVAYQIANVMNLFTTAIHASFSPWAYQNFQNGKYNKIGKTTLIIVSGFSLICFLFSLFAPELILILGGTNYYEAIWVVPPVAMSIVFNVMYSLVGTIAFYHEKTRFVMVGTTACAMLNIILNAFFINLYGFVAAGYTTLACYIMYAALHYIIMLRICKDNNIKSPFNGKALWGIACSSVLLSVIATTLYRHTIIRYAIIVVIIVGAFVFKKRILILKSKLFS